MDGLADAVKAHALELGFDLVGVARSGPAAGAARLDAWLAAGWHGDMGYMSRTAAVRADPCHLLPGCTSVVAVALSYRTSLPPSSVTAGPGRVWVSRYAWGRDYHKVVKRRLVHLGRWLGDAAPGCSWRACVDTAPLLEREWAAAAGLGWLGKSSSLINRNLGSELFLGFLLTDLDLAPDSPARDHCGRCTACLDACPTGAIVRPGEVDATRCIAYLTVEHRHEIPAALAPAMGPMVAGCDVCQEVCPWTRRAPADLHPEFAPAPHRYRPRLSDLEAFDEAAFRAWRSGSPLTRIPWPHFQRCLQLARHNLGG